MKSYIKSVAALLLMSLALVSCNENFDDADNVTAYPEKLSIGTWAREYAPAGSVDYTINFTIDEAGDTICDITTYNAANGMFNVFSGGEVSYDKLTGMAEIYYEESPYNAPAVVYATYQSSHARMTCIMYAISNGKLAKKDNFVVVRSEAPSVLGDWNCGNLEFTLRPDGTATVVQGNTTSEATYTFTGKSGSITLADGTAIALSLNEKGQMVATYNGESLLASHVQTVIREDWVPYAKGIYSCAMNDAPAELTMEYSANQQMIRIKDFCDPGSELTAYWKIGEAAVTPAESMFWAFDHPSHGSVFAIPTAITADGATALFQNGTFNFGFSWDVPGVGTFGKALDTFTITETL